MGESADFRPPACIEVVEGSVVSSAWETKICEKSERIMTKRAKTGLIHCAVLLLSLAMILGLPVSVCAQTSSYVEAGSTLTVDSGSAAVSASLSETVDEPILTIKKRVDEVNVLFIATDRRGKFVRNLNQADFSIFDDHKPVESILNFRRETDLPIELGLLMDVSGSVQGRFGFEKEAATGFLQHIIRPGYDRAFVIGFNKQSHLTQDFTDQVPLLAAGVQRLSNGGAPHSTTRSTKRVRKSWRAAPPATPFARPLSSSATAKTIRANTRGPRPLKWRSGPKFSSMLSPLMTAD